MPPSLDDCLLYSASLIGLAIPSFRIKTSFPPNLSVVSFELLAHFFITMKLLYYLCRSPSRNFLYILLAIFLQTFLTCLPVLASPIAHSNLAFKNGFSKSDLAISTPSLTAKTLLSRQSDTKLSKLQAHYDYLRKGFINIPGRDRSVYNGIIDQYPKAVEFAVKTNKLFFLTAWSKKFIHSLLDGKSPNEYYLEIIRLSQVFTQFADGKFYVVGDPGTEEKRTTGSEIFWGAVLPNLKKNFQVSEVIAVDDKDFEKQRTIFARDAKANKPTETAANGSFDNLDESEISFLPPEQSKIEVSQPVESPTVDSLTEASQPGPSSLEAYE